MLKTDPVLQFERHDSGWFLTDRRTGHAYHSPSDNPALPPGDVAYLSRQARPAGNGSFILLTGIHAVGSNGVIHYLTRELADLYEQVGTRRFSTLIASEFDPATRTITSSRRITPLYLHEDAVAVTDRVVVLLDGASVPMAWRLAAAMGPPGMSASSVQSRLAS